jgi:hypothetical protein
MAIVSLPYCLYRRAMRYAPYRETVSTHVESIQNALQDRGFDVELSAGFVKSKETYAYFIYDTDRFSDSTAAKAAVSRWLDRRMADQ